MFNQLTKLARYIAPFSRPLDLEKGLDEKRHAHPKTLICLEQMAGNQCTEAIKAIVLGKRATGKSSLIMELIKHHISKTSLSTTTVIPVLIFHGTEHVYPIYHKFKDDLIASMKTDRPNMVMEMEIHMAYNGSVLDKFLQKHHDSKNIFIAFDTCFEMGSSKCKILDLATTQQYVNFVISADHPLGVPLHIRDRCRYLFLFKEQIYTYRKRIYTLWHLEHIFDSLDIFQHMYSTATDAPYGYLLVDFVEKTCYIGRSLTRTFEEDERMMTIEAP